MGKRGRKAQVRQAILEALSDRRPHSARELTAITGSSEPRGHIRDLIKLGYNIGSDWVRDLDGPRYKHYYLL